MSMDKFFFTVDAGTGILTAGQLLGQLPEGCVGVEFDDFRATILYWLAKLEPENHGMGDFDPNTAIDHELFEGMGPATVKKLQAGGVTTIGELSESSFTAIRSMDVKIIPQRIIESWVAVAKEVISGH